MSVLRLPRLFSGTAVLCAAVLAGSLVAAPAEATGKEPPVAADEPAPASVQAGAGDDHGGPAAGRFIVKFKERASRSSAGRSRAYGLTAKALGVPVEEIRRTATGAHVVAVDQPLDGNQVETLVSTLEASPDVAYVEPDRLMQPAALTPDDEFYGRQWNLAEERAGMRVPGAWDVSTGEGAVVAVIDTGITEHSDLAGKVLPGYDMIADVAMARDGNGRDADARDEGDWYGDGECGSTGGGEDSSWHGTHVAGTVAAVTGNGKGVAGIAPDARILPVRVLGTCGGFTSDISLSLIHI